MFCHVVQDSFVKTHFLFLSLFSVGLQELLSVLNNLLIMFSVIRLIIIASYIPDPKATSATPYIQEAVTNKFFCIFA